MGRKSDDIIRLGEALALYKKSRDELLGLRGLDPDATHFQVVACRLPDGAGRLEYLAGTEVERTILHQALVQALDYRVQELLLILRQAGVDPND